MNPLPCGLFCAFKKVEQSLLTYSSEKPNITSNGNQAKEVMVDDWQVGDKAVCVDASPCVHPFVTGQPFDFAVGEVATVVHVYCDRGRTALVFAERQPESPFMGFVAARFRKIRPDAHEPCEAEFVTLLNRKRVSA